MKILVFSDTHSHLDRARNVLKRIGGKMDMVFHLGDHDTDALELQKEFPRLPFHYVKGNNDYLLDTPMKKMVRAGGKALLLTHGHKQRVHWNPDTIAYWAEEQGADAVLFGHTHMPVNDSSGRVMLFNPGSISLPRGGTMPSFGILTIENGRMEGAIMEYWNEETFRRRERE